MRTAPDCGQIDEVAHLVLQLGRLLLQNGVDAEPARVAAARFAAAYGWETSVVLTHEALIVTVLAGYETRTKIGHRLPGMNVGMAAVEAINGIVERAETGALSLAEARASLDDVERAPPAYPALLVAGGLGVTAASLSRLFGGDWVTFLVACVAGAASTWLRLKMSGWRVNPILVAFSAALLAGILGGLGVLSGLSRTPSLCLVAPAMVLVPGVPLINGVQDMIRNHVTLGVSRLGFATLVTVAIGLGLFAATQLTGVAIPVTAPSLTIAAAEDAVFSALAAAGFVLLFGVPMRMAWAAIVCGVASHTSRALLFHAGVDMIAGTLIGALAAGLLAQIFGRRFHAPAAAFAFPGVVAMIPGSYAFRATIGWLDIAQENAGAALIADTVTLMATVTLMVGAIAIGIAAPAVLLALPRRR